MKNIYLCYIYNYLKEKIYRIKWNTYYLYNTINNNVKTITFMYNIGYYFNKYRSTENNLVIEKKNNYYKLLDNNFNLLVPKKPIINIYIEDNYNQIRLKKLHENLFNIDKEVPLFCIVKILEEINLTNFNYIVIKYIGNEERILLKNNLRLIDLIQKY